ncbi:Krueppel homolog 2 [Drosophila novamexicana]|uniref:Krueppel homolog 2 n=1 Tax=Drosophila novamexicana TaxID=47314 RepID=UPI0011E5A474|nr:Krueppel homolog 2 [Drosophila novamexicana]XP_030555285.1 Krueppel homolog 2 [Drosophila novamexicana]XP_030555286.1 Krueppel homolog 2 [Drosophila novamexicana]XP_030555287.1 Krueppel homolog 2 [Drosophila novamexicana]
MSATTEQQQPSFDSAQGDAQPSSSTTSQPQQQQQQQQQQQEQQQQQQTTQNATARLLQHFQTNRIDSALWALRLLVIFFTVSYVLPIFTSQQSAFNKVLLANAAISALRLHQRVPAFSFSREFLSRLFAEDSCHYMMYSLIFFSIRPTLLVLIPVALYSVLHASSYSLKLLDLIGQNSWWTARFVISIVEYKAANILKAIAFCEIFIMPYAIVLTFMAHAGLMTPIIYYHYLVMRYSSRRNPYPRTAFAELRITFETLAARSPPVVGKIIRGGIGFVNRLAPQPQPAPAQ